MVIALAKLERSQSRACRLASLPKGAAHASLDMPQACRVRSAKEISHLNGITSLATFKYGYDDNGNITSVDTSRSNLSNLSQSLSYTYDAINQLVSATNPIQGQLDETFNYDNLGNRLRNQSQAQDAVYDKSNRLLENQTHTYTYDLEGNMTSKEDKITGFLTQYTWDEENQLIQIVERDSISTPATKTVNYVYDVLGRRIEKNVDGVITRYIYDNEDILFEIDGNNQIAKVFTHGGGIDEPLSFEDKLAQQTYFYHSDHLGSIIGLSDSTGNLVQNYVYDSFGNVSIFDGSSTGFNLGSEPIKQPYGYTSRELDSESDLYYYRARYYRPSTGRFQADDPIHFGGRDTNLSRYVINNPINFKDEYGMQSQSSSSSIWDIFDVEIDPDKQNDCQKEYTKKGIDKLLKAIEDGKYVPDKLLNRCVGRYSATGKFEGECTRLKVFEDAIRRAEEKRRKKKQCIFKARRYCPTCSVSHCNSL